MLAALLLLAAPSVGNARALSSPQAQALLDEGVAAARMGVSVTDFSVGQDGRKCNAGQRF